MVANDLNIKQKLLLLRSAMKNKGLSGFIQPMNDEYQNEYVPASAKRIEWLSDFSGSAGNLVILKEKAAIFVDGRYILQAQNEVNKELFEVYNIKDKTPNVWLAENASKNDLIGFDTWLHTEGNISKLQKEIKSKIVPVANLIDEIWEGRPAIPLEKMIAHSTKFSGESSQSKIKKVAKIIKERGAAFQIITSPDSICWLLNIRGNDVENTPLVLAFAFLYNDGKVELFIEKEKVSVGILNKNVVARSKSELQNSLAKQRSKKVLIDPKVLPFWFSEELKRNNYVILKADDPIQLLKACKNETEINGTKEAHRRDGAALVKFLYWLEKNYNGKDEVVLADKLLEIRKEGKNFMQPSFPTICGFAGNGAIVHYRAQKHTAKKVLGNGLLLIDSGGQYLDGTTDITRAISIGTPTKEQKQNFTRVLKGHIAIASIKFPQGITGAELDVLARQYLWNVGLDYDHGTGHGVGVYLGVHEGPQRISRYSNVELRKGMILSNEPGYYKTGEYGIRIENLIVVKEEKLSSKKAFLGFETITKAPIDLKLVEFSMLTEAEKKWLLEYHKDVVSNLSKLLDKKVLAWLRKSVGY